MGRDKKQKKSREEREKSEDSEKTDVLQADISQETKGRKKLNDSEEDNLSRTMKSKLNFAKGQSSEEESEIEIITLEQQGKKKKKSKTKTKKSNFSLLEIEGENLDSKDSSAEEDAVKNAGLKDNSISNDVSSEKPSSKTNTKAGKKSKKKERKKKDKDDEDLEKILEELALEMVKPSEVSKDNEVPVSKTAEIAVKDKDQSETQAKKIEKSDSSVVEELNDKESSPGVVDDLPTVKTAAQKKKEKKERERLKKLSQFEQNTSKKKPEPEVQRDLSPAPKPAEDESIIDDEKDDDDGSKKKKKKGKKKDDDDKKDKKRPGKKQIAAMQEALRKVKEEEERLRLEEEAKIKAAEEAERMREEQLRLEQERKERKKQKEKEKRERLKAEGKLLTKTQKQNRARMEATLAVLRQQGVEVPQIGEKKEKGPRLGDRKKMQKKRATTEETPVEVPKADDLNVPTDTEKELLPEVEESEAKKDSASASEDENVKDAWYETSDEDDVEEEEQTVKRKTDTSKSEKIPTVKKEKKSDTETDSSGSESSSDEESESEDDSGSSSSSSEGDDRKDDLSIEERVKMRIQKRREVAESNRSMDRLRSPIVCVLGHVDTGKTKILDKIRSSHVQDSEAGGITQQIGATMVPHDALQEQCKMVKNFTEMELKVPGLLIIDTPGHESFSNLRSRGSSLCDIAILVVDITHGLEPQTIESLNMLKQRKTPFIVALNKIDRVYEWKSMKNKDVSDVIKGQSRSTKQFFDDRVKQVILEFANQSLNAVLYYENKDPRTYISMVPTSALTGDGMGNLMALLIELTQSMMAKRLQYSEELQATVLEVKAISGLGHTMDVILVNGRLKEGDTIVFAGYDGPVSSQIRSLLMPQPLKELRIKTQFIEHREIEGAQGVKVCGKDLEKAIAGLPLLVPRRADETKILMEEIAAMFRETMNAIKVTGMGVYVQTSTLGSLEALMEFLNESKIPVSGVRIGPVTKKDVMKASAMLEHDPTYAVILAFDVRIEREAQELADSLSIKIFHANIIYHLFDMFVNYRTELKERNREQHKNDAVFPCKLRILPQFIFNSRDPIVVGVSIEAGVLKEGTPLCVPTKEFLEIGTVTTIEVNHKQIDLARKGQEVCIKIEPSGGEAPKMYGRHFDHTDMLVSKITRYSIDVCKEHFRDDLLKTDWQLMVELKKLFQIL